MIYIDGEYFEKNADAKISVYDHGLLYGDGIFEGIRYYNKTPFRLQEHLKRLAASARGIRLAVPASDDELEKIIEKLIQVSPRRDGYIRLNVTRGRGNLGLNPLQCPKASLIIIEDTISLYPEEFYAKGISVCTSHLRRVPVDCLDPRIKSLNYLNNVLAKFDAIDRNCQEALILNQAGFVAECTADNIFYFKDGFLFTPETASGALSGVTRGVVLELVEKLGLPAQETRVSLYDLYNAAEVFLTGTAAEIVPVVMIDGRAIGNGLPGEFTRDIHEAFKAEAGSTVAPQEEVG